MGPSAVVMSLRYGGRVLSGRLPDLDSLELLLTLSSTGSIGRAAAIHGLGQPAATARI